MFSFLGMSNMGVILFLDVALAIQMRSPDLLVPILGMSSMEVTLSSALTVLITHRGFG